jgi:purine catabolism regulator
VLPASGDYAITVRDLIELPSMTGAELAAGAAGIDASINRVNVMEVPDILPWVKPDELLLTTGYPLRHPDTGRAYDDDELVGFVGALAARGVAALGVKAGRYLDELPAPMLAAADRLGFALLSLPVALGFDDVMGEVFTALVDRQAAALDAADRLHRALTAVVLEGGGLPQIAEEVARALSAAVLICTPDGRVQATAGTAEDRAALDGLSLFDPSGRFLVERVRPGMQPAPGARGQLLTADIGAGGTDHGRIVVHARAGRLGTATVQSLDRAATVAALAITKQLAVAAVESKFRGDFLRDALTGSAGGPDQVLAHCAELGWDIGSPLVVVVAQLDDLDDNGSPLTGHPPHERLTAAWQQVVGARFRAAPVVGISQEIVALVPATEQTAQATVTDLVAAVTGDRGGGRRSFSAGVSRVVRSPDGLPAGYDQARKALLVGRRTRGRGAVAHFDSLGVHRLLSLVTDSGELRNCSARSWTTPRSGSTCATPCRPCSTPTATWPRPRGCCTSTTTRSGTASASWRPSSAGSRPAPTCAWISHSRCGCCRCVVCDRSTAPSFVRSAQ